MDEERFSKKNNITLSRYICPIIYLLVLTLAEYIITYNRADIGLGIHGLLVFILFWHSAYIRQKKPLESKFYGAFSITPLIRILSLSTPLITFNYLNWFTILGAILVVAIFVIIRIQDLTEENIGLIINWDRAYIDWLVILLSPGVGYLEYLILRTQPLIPEIGFYNLLAPVIIMVIFTGFVEEVTFRGILQYNGVQAFGSLFALPYVSLAFTVLHMGNRSLEYLVVAFSISLAYAFTVRFTGSVLGVTIAHGLGNVMLFLVYPLVFQLPLG